MENGKLEDKKTNFQFLVSITIFRFLLTNFYLKTRRSDLNDGVWFNTSSRNPAVFLVPRDHVCDPFGEIRMLHFVTSPQNLGG